MIGGEGKDNIYDKSVVKGPGHYTKIYDNGDNTFNTGNESRTFISNDTLKNDYKRKSFKYDWLAPMQRPGYNPDDGFYIGGNFIALDSIASRYSLKQFSILVRQ